MTTGCECPYSPAEYSPSRSTYSWPSASSRIASHARVIRSGKGRWYSTLRVLPPGRNACARSCSASVRGRRAAYSARASSTAALTASESARVTGSDIGHPSPASPFTCTDAMRGQAWQPGGSGGGPGQPDVLVLAAAPSVEQAGRLEDAQPNPLCRYSKY